MSSEKTSQKRKLELGIEPAQLRFGDILSSLPLQTYKKSIKA